ncbi:Complex 1 protein (LYR family) [Rhizoctonia solani]|uniref:LYR motif-containing protein 2 n=1 Tax=Rhizoctonia solani TaxID=456999 RepID=A0A8H8NSI1_9AGAM|nr:Complex 1 protein (LYR family) [Rhizoctonia solani]QRW19231.1 Complex 1 protein (LYR family) [Rhizoctonia solani]
MKRGLPLRGPTLRHFLLKAEVFSVYRQVIRACRKIPNADARRETLEWFKHDFRRSANVTDLDAIQGQLASIKRELKTTSSMFSLPIASH